MHPYQHVFLHRGPSRIFWFFIGAGVATWWHHSYALRDHRAQYFPCVMPHRRVQDPPSNVPVQEAASWRPDRTPTGWQQHDWDQDKQQLGHLRQRTGETIAELSESTLDSIIAGAESLKARLVELRAERERLEAQKKASQPDA